MLGKAWWRGAREIAPWFVLHAVLPGAAVFVLLVWLAQLFVRDGFADMRQYGLAPGAAPTSLARMQRSWWSCTCRTTCACLSAIERGLRRCCARSARISGPHVLAAS